MEIITEVMRSELCTGQWNANLWKLRSFMIFSFTCASNIHQQNSVGEGEEHASSLDTMGFIKKEEELLDILGNYSALDGDTRLHLQNTYITVMICTLCSANTAYIYLHTDLFSPLMPNGIVYILCISTVAILGFILHQSHPHHSEYDPNMRLLQLILISICFGIMSAAVVEFVLSTVTYSLPIILLSSCMIVCSFAIGTNLCQNRKHMFIYSAGISILSLAMLLYLVNVYVQWEIGLQIVLCITLAMYNMYMIYSTQLLVDKFQDGDDDFIHQTLELFTDGIHLLHFIMQRFLKKKQT